MYIHMIDSTMKTDINNVVKYEALEPPSPHKNTGATTIHRQIALQDIQQLLEHLRWAQNQAHPDWYGYLRNSLTRIPSVSIAQRDPKESSQVPASS